MNRDKDSNLVLQLRREIQQLRQELQLARGEDPRQLLALATRRTELQQSGEEVKRLEERAAAAEERAAALQAEVRRVRGALSEAQRANAELEAQLEVRLQQVRQLGGAAVDAEQVDIS